MKNILVIAFFLVAGLASRGRAEEWILRQSTLTYHVSHALHQVYGTSHAAKGKGVCRDHSCEFLIAAPVKTFDSGDSNRDLHMLQVTKGGQFPLIVVRSTVPESADGSAISVDLEIEFAGQNAVYKGVKLNRTDAGSLTFLTGTLPLVLTDFKIVRPSLLAIPIKDETPVAVDMTWERRP
jgi:hypothetical protein